jgi:hypothetical protein
MTLKADGTNGILQQYDYQVLTTGFTYTFAAGTTVLVINPAGTLATGTITMPASPVDGMTITFSSTKLISALTLSGNTGQTVVSAATILPANQATTYVYRLSNTSWYPMSTVATNTLGAGTTTVAPLVLTSGTNLTSAIAGAVEYDGKVVYGTPIGTQRGIVPTQQYYRLNAAVVGADSTSAQSIFGVGVTLSASTVYEFEIFAVLAKTAGATSHSIALGFGGTATINNILWEDTSAQFNSALPNTSVVVGAASNSASSLVVTSAVAAATTTFIPVIKGTVSVNAGGTFIPQYTLSAAPGGAYSTVAGSYIRINPIGASGANTSVGTWA